MEITNELLAAYAEGNVTPEERKAVREYLTEHPSQLESVMMMMDEDYGMEAKQHSKDISFMGLTPPRVKQTRCNTAALVDVASESYFGLERHVNSSVDSSFQERMDDLLDEII